VIFKTSSLYKIAYKMHWSMVGRSNLTGNYKATLYLDSVCSVAGPPNGSFVPSAEDAMEFSVILTVEDHPSLVDLSSPRPYRERQEQTEF